jgi:hypothetical protein
MPPRAPEPPLLERWGIRYFRALSTAKGKVEAADEIHVLNPGERAELRAIQRWAIVRACIAGALSTIASAVAELWVLHHEHSNALYFWGVVGGVTAGASAIEIGYLYWDGLRAVHALAHAAGLELFPEGDEGQAVAGAMARAALELPNPTGTLFGVDPRREASKLRLLVASIVYKAKVSVSNFLIKALIRRILGRAFVRAWLPFVAVPITAAWNGVVCWLIIREARIRAMGPSAAKEMVDGVLAEAPDLSAEGRAAVVRAVASSIVRTEDLHPNLVALLREVRGRMEGATTEAIDDTRLFLERIRALPEVDRRAVVRVLAVAAIVDGKLTSAERRLLVEARDASRLPLDLDAVERLRRAFVSGDPIPRSAVLDVA